MAGAPPRAAFSYARSCDFDLKVDVKIVSLEGPRQRRPFAELASDPRLQYSGAYQSDCSDLLVTCQAFSDGKAMALPIQTGYKAFADKWEWNEWLTLPVKYCDLARNAMFVWTIWDVFGPSERVPVGGTSLNVFAADGTLRKGEFILRVWPDVEGSTVDTPGETGAQLEVLNELVRKHTRHEMVHVEWLDKLTMRKIDGLKEKEKVSASHMHLTIEFPQFDHPVVFQEIGSDLPNLSHASMDMDPEMLFADNLVENKHHQLTRSRRRGPLDRDLKPNPAIRDILAKITKKAPTDPIAPFERDLLWRFRFYLSKNKKALTKFLKCIDWSNPAEAKQGIELLDQWEAIDVDDALELLSSQFKHPAVRSYAVSRLEKANDDDLLLYLLQLVQALRYENVGKPTKAPKSGQRSLEQFLIKRALTNFKLGNFLYWYLLVECKNKEKKVTRVFVSSWQAFVSALNEGSAENRKQLRLLNDQRDFVTGLRNLVSDMHKASNRRTKIERLRQILQESEEYQRCDLRLPLDSDVHVVGVYDQDASVFKSALMPIRLTFKTKDGGKYTTIYKTGDDLRQDQLVIQIITLMDKLLKKENLDLKLTPYRVLATSAQHGLVQFVEAEPIFQVLKVNGSIQNFFRKWAPSEGAPYGIKKEVMDTYIKSCAGYCVITYLLGVGDRHLDNLLLSRDGHLFHIDFGYILGRDPKPYPPPMKLNKDMVEGFGGAQSEEMQRFRSHCFNCYLILRKHANLILNLFSLMVDSDVNDIALDPDKTVVKVQEKFRLDLGEEQAVQHFRELIDDSVNALFAQFVERVHSWAQYWRK